MDKKLIGVFYSSITMFLLIVLYFAIPFFQDMKRWMFGVMAIIAFIFMILGFVQIYLTYKKKVKGKLKFFLVLTGAVPLMFILSVLLHNFLYAMAIISENIPILVKIFEFLHAGFFLFGLLGCPILYIVGVVCVIVYSKKK